ncbi:MAG TPA: hypothetical protein VKT80_12560, partial [Chloroflexota bacterium]|nr:hypothetical protein [Chloroflexota bacterium]
VASVLGRNRKIQLSSSRTEIRKPGYLYVNLAQSIAVTDESLTDYTAGSDSAGDLVSPVLNVPGVDEGSATDRRDGQKGEAGEGRAILQYVDPLTSDQNPIRFLSDWAPYNQQMAKVSSTVDLNCPMDNRLAGLASMATEGA